MAVFLTVTLIALLGNRCICDAKRNSPLKSRFLAMQFGIGTPSIGIGGWFCVK